MWLHVFSPGALGLLQLAGNSDVGGPWMLLPEILQDTRLYPHLRAHQGGHFHLQLSQEGKKDSGPDRSL